MLDWFYREFHRPVDYKSKRLAWFWAIFAIQCAVLFPAFIWIVNAYPAAYFIAIVGLVGYAFILKEPTDSVHQTEEWWRGNLPTWKWVSLGWGRELRLRGGK